MVLFEALQVRLGLGLLHIFSDDGIVDSIEDHHRKLLSLDCVEVNPHRDKRYDSYRGYCYSRKRGILRRHNIFYIQKPRIEMLKTRAHEETHVIVNSGKFDRLLRRISDFYGRKFKSSDFDITEQKIGESDEVRADFGAIYALSRRGLDPAILKGFSWHYDHALQITA